MSKAISVILGVAQTSKLSGRAGSSGSASSSGRDKTDIWKVDPNLKNQILERDNYTCQCCGFRSEKYQEVLFRNHDPADHAPENLATACIFCHQCFYLERVGSMSSGLLIWLPEISQTDLHHLARAIFVARISQGPIADTARKILDLLLDRRNAVKERIGTDEVATLATVLQDYLGNNHYMMREKKLEGVKLFPLDRRIIKEADLEFNQFPQILAYWRSKAGPFGGKTPPQWVSIFQTSLKSI